jgi:hypothetical protein
MGIMSKNKSQQKSCSSVWVLAPIGQAAQRGGKPVPEDEVWAHCGVRERKKTHQTEDEGCFPQEVVGPRGSTLSFYPCMGASWVAKRKERPLWTREWRGLNKAMKPKLYRMMGMPAYTYPRLHEAKSYFYQILSTVLSPP